VDYEEGRRTGFDRITGTLYQGSAPPIGLRGFDVIVLCAEEYQPQGYSFPFVTVIKAPLDDAHLSRTEARIAYSAAVSVAEQLAEGKTVLVTCMQGRNRSGLVTALVLMMNGLTADRAIALIKSKRALSMQNPSFNAFLKQLGRRQRGQRDLSEST
jgi:hypothetical protein